MGKPAVFPGKSAAGSRGAGVKLAMHPDDPPMADLYGQPCIMVGFDAMERLVNMVPSPSNTLCFCQGTFSSQGTLDIYEGISRLGRHISFVHFRDVVGQVPKFRETFIDNGKTDMAKAMKAYMALPHSKDIVSVLTMCLRWKVRPMKTPVMKCSAGYMRLGT
jgi:D-mannonate dehydratase